MLYVQQLTFYQERTANNETGFRVRYMMIEGQQKRFVFWGSNSEDGKTHQLGASIGQAQPFPTAPTSGTTTTTTTTATTTTPTQ